MKLKYGITVVVRQVRKNADGIEKVETLARLITWNHRQNIALVITEDGKLWKTPLNSLYETERSLDIQIPDEKEMIDLWRLSKDFLRSSPVQIPSFDEERTHFNIFLSWANQKVYEFRSELEDFNPVDDLEEQVEEVLQAV